MIGILSDNYAEIIPLMPKYKAVTVFDLKFARIAFQFINDLDFVYCINEQAGTFAKCYCYADVVNFLTPDEQDLHNSK